MNFLGPIFTLLANVAGGALKWMGFYGGNKPTEARTTNDEQAKLSDFNKAQAEGDLTAVRSTLGESVPPK